MSLKLKGRRVCFERQSTHGDKKQIITALISQAPIWLEVITDRGDVTKVEENKLHFDLKKKGKGK